MKSQKYIQRYNQEKQDYQNNKEKVKKYHKQYYILNKNKIKLQHNIWLKKHPDYHKKYFLKKGIYIDKQSKELQKQLNKEWKTTTDYLINKRIEWNKYYRERRHKNKSCYIGMKLRTLVYIAFKKYSTTGKIMKSREYGIDYEAIINYLGPQPSTDYEIDHIKPLSSFNLNNLNEIKQAFAPENHRWLTMHENRSKNKKLYTF
jgi:hypothetical protein